MPLPKIKLNVLPNALEQDNLDNSRRNGLREEVFCAIEDINVFNDDMMQRIEVGSNEHVFLQRVSQVVVYMLQPYPEITIDPKE